MGCVSATPDQDEEIQQQMDSTAAATDPNTAPAHTMTGQAMDGTQQMMAGQQLDNMGGQVVDMGADYGTGVAVDPSMGGQVVDATGMEMGMEMGKEVVMNGAHGMMNGAAMNGVHMNGHTNGASGYPAQLSIDPQMMPVDQTEITTLPGKMMMGGYDGGMVSQGEPIPLSPEEAANFANGVGEYRQGANGWEVVPEDEARRVLNTTGYPADSASYPQDPIPTRVAETM